jgi:hypothetical protein
MSSSAIGASACSSPSKATNLCLRNLASASAGQPGVSARVLAVYSTTTSISLGVSLERMTLCMIAVYVLLRPEAKVS